VLAVTSQRNRLQQNLDSNSQAAQLDPNLTTSPTTLQPHLLRKRTTTSALYLKPNPLLEVPPPVEESPKSRRSLNRTFKTRLARLLTNLRHQNESLKPTSALSLSRAPSAEATQLLRPGHHSLWASNDQCQSPTKLLLLKVVVMASVISSRTTSKLSQVAVNNMESITMGLLQEKHILLANMANSASSKKEKMTHKL